MTPAKTDAHRFSNKSALIGAHPSNPWSIFSSEGEKAAEAGFTMVELLVAIAILSLVLGLLGAILSQFYRVTNWGNSQLAVDHDLRTAGLWLMRDGNQSATFTAGGSCGVFDTGRSVTYDYALNGSRIERTDSSTGTTRAVARYASNLSCTAGGGIVTITVESTKGNISKSATYTVTMRAN